MPDDDLLVVVAAMYFDLVVDVFTGRQYRENG
jgi:hypothetical protein